MMVPLDNGTHFIDQTSHRMKLFTSPPVEAVRDLTDRRATQKLDCPSVDFVVDRGRLQRCFMSHK